MEKRTKITVRDLNLYYGENHALKDVNMNIRENCVTAFIGPSGCGKSTFLKTLNRMNDLVDGVRITGEVKLDDEDIYAEGVDTTVLRKRIGMVFQQPNPFPMSIYDNIAYGPRVHGMKDKSKLDAIVEESLRGAAIFDEVKDRLKKSALGLSGGQQQRICIARALAVQPEVLLMDEPTSALDPISTSKIEELMEDLKKKYTVVVVTHNMQQAVRVSDDTAFFLVMRSKFDEQLRLLNQEMMYMGTMIEDSIQKAIEALIAQNAQLAEKIMNSDSDVDHEQKKIENICFNLLMQQQPVARDLRVISAAMKMVTDMERIGDHAADISEITIMLSKEPYVLNLDDIKKMASETVIMLIRSIEAYVEKDMNKAQEVIRHDDIVDDLFDKNKADIIELIRHDPEKGEQAADMLMVAKYFERIGDHATNIAEWVIFALNDKKEIKES